MSAGDASSARSGTVLFCGSSQFSASINPKLMEHQITTPHKFASMAGRDVAKVVMGATALHGMLITKQGSVFAFGQNDSGQLGLNDEKKRSAPRLVDVSEKIVDAACGQKHTLLLSKSGAVFVMGKNDCGQLGLGLEKVQTQTTPRPILADMGKVIKVACGDNFSMFLNDKGQLYTCGKPDFGCLGNGTDGKYFLGPKLTFHYEFSPILVQGWSEKIAGRTGEGRGLEESQLVEDVRIVDVVCGQLHTVAINHDGNVFTWGFGGLGRLGHNETIDEHRPRILEHFKPSNVYTGGAREAYTGQSCTIVLTRFNNGQPWFWGQLKSNSDATMYPKRYEDLVGSRIDCLGIGRKHVVVGTDSGNYALGSSPCYGELGYGDAQSKTSTTFKPMEPTAGLKLIGVGCGLAQTVIIVDNSTPEAKRALQKLPTLGVLSDKWEVLEAVEEANSTLAEKNQVVALDNVKQITDIVRIAEDATLVKLKRFKASITDCVRAVFEAVADDIQKEDFMPSMPDNDFYDLQRQEDTGDWVRDLVDTHGSDSDAITESLNAAIEETLDSV